MMFKRILPLICLVICLFAMASVCANDTAMASEDTSLELSADNEMEDNLQTNEENPTLAVGGDDKIASTQTDSEILAADQLTYSDLRDKIGSGGNINLTKGTYTYNDGDGGTIVISDSGVINGNGAIIDMAGSTIQAFYVGVSGITIKNLTIKNANYNGDGGAIYFSKSGTVENCNFTNNKVTGSNSKGGAIYFSKSGTVENCNFTNNKATGDESSGGAIRMSSGTVTNCNFTGNTAYREGGAIRISSGTVTNCNFADNSASAEGGAIYSFYWSTADTCIFKTSSDTTFNIGIFPPTLNVDNFTTFYGSGEKLTFNLTTDSGMPVTNGNISISVYFKDNSWVGNYSCLSGEGWAVSLPVGSYYANFTTEYEGFQAISRTITINKAKTELTAKAVTAAYNTNKKMVITLTDINDKPLSGLKLTVKIKSDKTYTTDKNGQVKISVGKLTPKTYNVKITFGENANYLPSSANVKVTVKKAKSKITAKKKTIKKAKKYAITLKSGKTPIKKAKVILKIKKKTFRAKTNKKGKATFKIKKLKKGKYTAKVTFKGNKYYKKSTKKVRLRVR